MNEVNHKKLKTDELFRVSVENYNHGNLKIAEITLSSILEEHSIHPEALYYLGLVFYHYENIDKAIDYIKKAIEANPSSDAIYYLSLGDIYVLKGENATANKIYTEGLKIDKFNLELFYKLGKLNCSQGDFIKAEKYYLNATKISKNQVVSYNNLGLFYSTTNDLEKSIKSFKKAIDLAPDNYETYNNYGAVLYEHQKLEEAKKNIEISISLNSKYANAYFNLGLILNKKEKHDEAIINYQKTIELNSDYYNAYVNIGIIYASKDKNHEAIEQFNKAQDVHNDPVTNYYLARSFYKLKKYHESINCFNEAIKLNPNYFEAYDELANLYLNLEQYDYAYSNYEKAININPENKYTLNNMGNVLLLHGDIKKAIEVFNKVILFDSEFSNAYNNLASCYMYQGQLAIGLKYYKKALTIEPDNIFFRSNLLLCLNYLPDVEQKTILNECKNWIKKHILSTVNEENSFLNIPDNNHRIRVGYVSGNFNSHPISFFMEPIFNSHNKHKFEVVVYSATTATDSVTQRLKGLVSKWHDIEGVTDENVKDIIREDGVDILVDLDGHTANSRISIFANKNAPIQVSYLGYPNTTGFTTIDYRITDSLADPVKLADSHYTEKLLRLPESFLCYRPHQDSPKVGDLPSLASGHITFASFNNTAKINEKVIECWSKILLALPNSRLLLKSMSVLNTKNWDYIKDQFKKNKVPLNQIEFTGRVSSYTEHLEKYRNVDIALDTFPYNGTTTTFDALWMGVPVITLKGNTHRARVGVSVLSNVGLPELIEDSIESYISSAIELSNDLDSLALLRKGLREKVEKSCLINSTRFTKSLEKEYRKIWIKWCEENKGNLSSVDALINEAERLLKNNQFKKSITYYEQVISINPDMPEIYNNIGLAFHQINDVEKAEFYFKKSLSLKPNYADAHLNIGNIYKDINIPKKAVSHYEKAIDLKPDYAEAYNNLGHALNKLGYLEKSRSQFEKALSLNPSLVEVYNNLANVCKDQGNIKEAINYYEHSLKLNLHNSAIHSNLLYCLSYQEEIDSEAIFRAHQIWEQIHAASISVQPYANKPDLNRRIRIGYVSPDYYKHSVAFFIEPVLSNHNHKDYEIIVYDNSVQHDDVSERLQNYVDKWHFVHNLNTEEFDKLIRDNSVDILVDLAGHTANNSLKLFSRKPAPVQITYLGYPNTSGLSTMDYRITDAWADPLGLVEQYYSEKLIRLPTGFLCYQPQPDCPPVNRSEKNLNEIVFASFNNFTKVNKKVMTVWSEILRGLPNAKLLIKSSQLRDEKLCRKILSFFEEKGVNTTQINFSARAPSYSEHMNLYNNVDIALDTFPYNGTATTCEALWMGIPVITFSGNSHLSRVGLSILSQVGLSELISKTSEDYIKNAIELASNPKKLSKYHSTLRARMTKSTLLDSEKFVSLLEKKYRSMWQAWCNKNDIESNQNILLNQKNNVISTRKLHIGGKEINPAWEIFDQLNKPHVNHVGNAMDLSRFDDNTFSEIYASHVLEHFDFTKEVSAALAEWYRVLKPGGTLYVSVPNMETLCKLFIDNDINGEDRYSISRMIFGGHTDKYDYHKIGITKEFLETYLITAGFTDICIVDDFGIFQDSSIMKFHDVPISLNMISKKPVEALQDSLSNVEIKKSQAPNHQNISKIFTNSNKSILPINIKHNLTIGVPNNIHFLTTYILLEQEDWFETEIDFVRNILKEGMQCIDIGANYGIYTMVMAQCVGQSGNVWSFEPTESLSKYVEWSIKNNNLSNINYSKLALSDHSGEAFLNTEQNSEANKIVNAASENTTTVQLETLDEYKNNTDKSIDFIKIDAEGHEVKILSGAKEFLKNNSPLIMFEINYNEIINIDLIQHFLNLNFSCYKLVSSLNLLVPYNHNEKS